MSKKPLVYEVYLIRALAMIGVIAVHGTSFTTVDLAGQSDVFWIYQALNRFGKLGTPVFIFLSSFVLFYNYADRKMDSPLVKRFYSRRLNYILIPYVCWTVFYFFFNGFYIDHYIYDNAIFTFVSLKDFWIDLFYGKAHPHLYFVVINIQFYVLFPLVLWLLNRRPSWAKHLLWSGFLIQWLYYAANHEWISRFMLEHNITYFKGSIFLSYTAYFGLGAFIGTYFSQVKSWLKQAPVYITMWTAWLGFGLFYTWIYYRANVHGLWFHSFWYEFGWNMYTYISCFALLHLSTVILARRKRKLAIWLTRLGGVTFGIYLIHPAILHVWRLLPFSNQILVYHAQVWLGMAAALFISWAVILLIRRSSSKLYTTLFGHWSVPDLKESPKKNVN